MRSGSQQCVIVAHGSALSRPIPRVQIASGGRDSVHVLVHVRLRQADAAGPRQSISDTKISSKESSVPYESTLGFVRVILANPSFNLLPDLERQLAGQIGLALRYKPVVVVGAGVPLAA
jgi:hypothetical protein